MKKKITLPPFSCDCHTHVVGPKSIYPLIKKLIYIPEEATDLDIQKFLNATKLKRVVLVQPSFYGTDNLYMEYALKRLGNVARGVAVVEDTISNEDIDRLHGVGVRGIRINASTFVGISSEKIETKIKKSLRIVERNGWHIQFFLKPKMILSLKKSIEQLPANIIFDHFGFMNETTFESEEFKFLISLLEKGKTWIKLSAPYRLSKEGTFSAIEKLLKYYIQKNPDRLVWGSDWPHTPVHRGEISDNPELLPYRKFNIPERIEELSKIVNEASIFKKIMQDNPERLYDFSN